MNTPPKAAAPAAGALVLDAEALYRELQRAVQPLVAGGARLVGIASGGAWLAERLQQDLGLPGKPGIISFSVAGSVYNVITDAVAAAVKAGISFVTASGNGYAITRSYLTLEGEPVDLTSVPTGTRLITLLEVTPFANGEARLMVSDPLPAGFEIDNPNLISSGSVPALAALGATAEVAHSEFRQDRFLAAIDRRDAAPFRLAYVVRAISPGTFHHPAASVEDMYRPDFRARGAAGQTTVTE